MAFSTDNKAITAFKNLLNKAMTDSLKELGNEAEGSFFNVDKTTIFTESINSNPVTAVSDGVAVQVIADMTLDNTSNSHAYFAEWPVTPPTGTDPQTLAAFAYGAGSLVGIVAGDRVRNSISSAYGAGFESKPYTGAGGTGSLIAPGDTSLWIYQYQPGVYFRQETALGSTPASIILYVYIGKYLTDTITELEAASGKISLADTELTALVTVLDGDLATNQTITDATVQDSRVKVILNGVEVDVGPGKECVFKNGSTPFNERTSGDEQQGDTLHWNGSVAGYQLETDDRLDFEYLTT